MHICTNTKSLFKFITHRNLLVNIIAGLALLAAIVFGFFGFLDWFTGHGEYEKIPNITGKDYQAAKVLLESKGFSVEVADSVYDRNAPKLSVIKQTPEADALVKHGRTIYLTINRLQAPLIDMPNLEGYSLRSAQVYLKSLGLEIGDTTFKPNWAKNSILEQRYQGNPIKAGTKIPIGSRIDLVIAAGIGNEEREMPDLVGLTYRDAVSLLGNMNIVVGIPILLDPTIRDTANAFVAKQDPPVYNEPLPGQKVRNTIRAGQVVDLFLTLTKPVADTTATSNPLNNYQKP